MDTPVNPAPVLTFGSCTDCFETQGSTPAPSVKEAVNSSSPLLTPSLRGYTSFNLECRLRKKCYLSLHCFLIVAYQPQMFILDGNVSEGRNVICLRCYMSALITRLPSSVPEFAEHRFTCGQTARTDPQSQSSQPFWKPADSYSLPEASRQHRICSSLQQTLLALLHRVLILTPIS